MLRALSSFGRGTITAYRHFNHPQLPVQLCNRYLSDGASSDEKKTVKDEEYFRRFVKTRRFDAQDGDPSSTASELDRDRHVTAVLPEDGAPLAKIPTQETRIAKSDSSLISDIGKNVDLDLSNLRPVLKQAGNLAAYVNESDTLQKLVKIGVDLHAIETSKIREGGDLILRLDFEADIKPCLVWLHSIGVPNSGLGKVITKNPMILGESLEDMKNRVGYLEAKRFSPESIGRIVYKAPKFLTMDVKEADGKLGFYQKEFSLTGPEVREATTRLPKLITFPISTAKWCKYALCVFLGFSQAEAKKMFIANPKVLLTDKYCLMERFDYMYDTMNISHRQMAEWPQIFRTRVNILKQRHGFLEKIGRAQYDPTKENYISLHKLVGNDVTFCMETAKRPLSEYNDFLKSV